MQNSKVIHLVSNSFTHPKNTASSFKVSYNVPFDLTGKKVALIDIGLTKSSSNVLNETIAIKSHIPPLKKYSTVISNNATLIASEEINTWEKFFQVLGTSVKDLDGNDIVDISTTLNKPGKLVRYVIGNGSTGLLRIKISSALNSSVGWILQRNALTFRYYNLRTQSQSATKEHIELELKKNETVALEFRVNDMARYPEFPSNKYDIWNEYDFIFQFRKSYLNPQPPKIEAFQPGPGHFENVDTLINRLNSLQDFSNHAVLSFSNGVVQLVTKPSSYKKEIDFGGLEHQLGFMDRVLHIKNGETHTFKSTFPPNMTRGTHHFYIYSSLVNGVTVNEKILPLLATVDATKGKYGQQVIHSIRYPLFVDCVHGPQQVIEITISDDMGSTENILAGRTKLTLAIQ